MHITLVMAASIDGKITDGDGAHLKTSDEDVKLLASIKEEATLIIMGRRTFESARPFMKLSKKTLRVVLTRNPEKFKDSTVSGQLEFTDEKPAELIHRLEQDGHKDAILFGGGETNGVFLEAGLVEVFRLTIEPVIMGRGKELASVTHEIQLRLLSVERLNEKGSHLFMYEVMK